MIIPGIVISILTFPGVAVHELAHQICCKICRIPVYKVKYFQVANPCGYVLHEATSNPWKNLITSLGPFFINTILGMLITLPAYANVFGYNYVGGMLGFYVKISSWLLYWLGVSILMHAFPSTGDAKALIKNVLKNEEVGIVAKIVTTPFIGLIYIGALGSMLWLDLIYGIGMSMLLPKLFPRLFRFLLF